MGYMSDLDARGVKSLHDYTEGREDGIAVERERVLKIIDNILAQDPMGFRVMKTEWVLGIIRSCVAKPEED